MILEHNFFSSNIDGFNIEVWLALSCKVAKGPLDTHSIRPLLLPPVIKEVRLAIILEAGGWGFKAHARPHISTCRESIENIYLVSISNRKRQTWVTQAQQTSTRVGNAKPNARLKFYARAILETFLTLWPRAVHYRVMLHHKWQNCRSDRGEKTPTRRCAPQASEWQFPKTPNSTAALPLPPHVVLADGSV